MALHAKRLVLFINTHHVAPLSLSLSQCQPQNRHAVKVYVGCSHHSQIVRFSLFSSVLNKSIAKQ